MVRRAAGWPATGAIGQHARVVCWPTEPTTLPQHAEAELRVAPVVRHGDHAGGHVRDIQVGGSKIRVIQEVEDLRSELQPGTAERDALDDVIIN